MSERPTSIVDSCEFTVPLAGKVIVSKVARRLERERDELKGILRELLNIIPEPECHDFHHTKEERHSMFETCPVMERYDGLIEQARRAAK